MVCEFLGIFPEDICDSSPNREVEFAIDLVPDTIPVPMSPYRMYALELSKLKKQLKDQLEKKFVRSNVSLW